MTTTINPIPAAPTAPQALNYHEAMQNLATVVHAKPTEGGIVTLQTHALTTVQVQAGQHYTVRQLGRDGKTWQTPDNVVAVRHADALHLRYADGSLVSFENFYAVCTDDSVCSVNLAGDSKAGNTLSAANPIGGGADDGLLVYAHGNAETLMTMAQGQDGLWSAMHALDEVPVITYLPPDTHLGAFAVLALGVAGAAGAASANGGAAAVIGASLQISTQDALTSIAGATENNTAGSSHLAASVYAAAGVSGVNDANLGAINSALDSQSVNGIAVDTAPELQAVVNAYNAILASADGIAGNTTTALTAAQYGAVGVTGVSDSATAGSVLALLDNTIDAIPATGVQTVAQLQELANAAMHVLAGAGGRSDQAAAITQTDLAALGIDNVTSANLALVQAAIQATTPDSAIDTREELQAIVNTAIASTTPVIASALGGVSNLDVTSNLVFSANQTVTTGTGFIHIKDLGGTGYQGDTHTNNQTIDVGTAIADGLLTISGTGANTKIIINPKWDLDLSSNYQIGVDDGAFMSVGTTPSAVHIADVNFSTVTPGTHVAGTAASEAAASQTMVDATGALAAGKSWLDIQGIGNNTGAVTQLGDLSGGAYALVMKNYATTPGGGTLIGFDGITAHDTNVGVVNFGKDDIVYFDSQVNDASVQFFDARYSSMANGASLGGLAGQNALVLGLENTRPQQHGSNAVVLLGLEGNTSNKVYASIVTLPDGTVGWANDWHSGSPAVVMG